MKRKNCASGGGKPEFKGNEGHAAGRCVTPGWRTLKGRTVEVEWKIEKKEGRWSGSLGGEIGQVLKVR